MRRLLLCAVLCGALVPSGAHAVVGGRPATQPYPAMAALQDADGLRCGATLVAPTWLLTAAHCVRGVQPAELTALLGSASRSQRAIGSESLRIAQVVVHESYGRPRANSHDVALLRLATPSVREPIRIPAAGERRLWTAGTPARLLGWGRESHLLGASPDGLREVDLPIVPDGRCADSYRLTLGFEPTTMVCAGELLGARDACAGDSGGPLLVRDGGGALVQVGVVSFGLGCGYPTQYGVYARVADGTLRGWISARIATPAPAPAVPAIAPRPARLTVGAVRRDGRRVRVHVTATAAVRQLRLTLVRIRDGRRTVLASTSRKGPLRRATVTVPLRRGTSTRGTVRVELRARDADGRQVSASRRVQVTGR